MSEDSILESMAAEGMPFDMNAFLDMSPMSGVAHLD